MKKLVQIILSILLMLLFSGCMEDLTTPKVVKPKIDPSLESIDKSSVRYIPDINSIAFEWQRASTHRVKGYIIYRADLSSDDRKLVDVAKIDTVYTTHYIDDKLKPKTRYLYRFTTYDKDGIEGVPTKDIEIVTLDRPEAVGFVQAISNLPKTAKIIWRPHQSERIKGYRIYKNDGKTNEWEELTQVNGRLNAEYLDKDLDHSKLYRYKVVALTYDNIESYQSEVTQCVTKPLPKTLNLISATKDRPKDIMINWSESDTPDFVEYRLYRATSFDGDYELQARTQNSSYTDNIKKDGRTYFYKVTAVDKDGLESLMQKTPIMGSTLMPPQKPVISSITTDNGRVVLTWSPTDSRTQSYMVTKKVKQGWNNYQSMNIKDIIDTRFIDTNVQANTEYQYTVRSVDDTGLMSEESEVSTITVPSRGLR